MTHFENAMNIVQSEANCLADTYLLADRLSEPQRTRVQGLCQDYAEQVVKFEWPGMAEYGIPMVEWASLILGGVVTMFIGHQRRL